jgi:ABC-type sugar transport system ATPase subunit
MPIANIPKEDTVIGSTVSRSNRIPTMSQAPQQIQVDGGGSQPKWFNSPLTTFSGPLPDIQKHIPTFERRSFALAQSDNNQARLNEHLDTIVRLPYGDDEGYVPIGVVSKNYVLIPHMQVFDVVVKALKAAKITPAEVKTEIQITEYGERMVFSLYLPDKYEFDPGDGNPMALRLECMNSVDGSSRFRAIMGWFRYVCCNGLIIGVTRSDLRRRHVGDLNIDDIEAVLTSGLTDSEAEMARFKVWRNTPITISTLSPWVDKNLLDGWGFKAAARAFHIAQCGFDAEVIRPYKDYKPTTISMRKTNPVPGSTQRCSNLFDLSQILAWLAKERRDIQEQLEWREKIPSLMEPLLNCIDAKLTGTITQK